MGGGGRGRAALLDDEEGDHSQHDGEEQAQNDADDDVVGVVEDLTGNRRHAICVDGVAAVLDVPGGGFDGRAAVDLGLAIPALRRAGAVRVLLDVLVKALALQAGGVRWRIYQVGIADRRLLTAMFLASVSTSDWLADKHWICIRQAPLR